jgi:hypothetical protein
LLAEDVVEVNPEPTVRDKAAQIQKVRAEVEAAKSAGQTFADNP